MREEHELRCAVSEHDANLPLQELVQMSGSTDGELPSLRHERDWRLATPTIPDGDSQHQSSARR